MGLISIMEIIRLFRKNIWRLLAISLAATVLGAFVASRLQTYTCTLGFKYNYPEAAEELAPDGASKLDPYEIQNPVVIQAALEEMGISANDKMAKGIRQNITVSKVVTALDKEVSESAALLGEKYDVAATEYEMSFQYPAERGKDFGSRMFSNIIHAYDDFLLNKYYNKRTVEDFAKVVRNSGAEYIVIAESMSSSLDSIIEYLDNESQSYPDFRSKATGYTFSELSGLYQNLRNIQYAKYYGNIRAGNLAKDREMVIKSYQTKVQDLWEQWSVDRPISENYKNEILTFYDSYKAAGLYNQAERVQQSTNSSNNRDQDVLEDTDLEDYTNTYDDIILSYASNAASATDAIHTINYYDDIIDAYSEDTVPDEVKEELLSKNETILQDIFTLSAEYSSLANQAINELYAIKINDDLQYLILPEVNEDIPVKLIAVFLGILAFGAALIAMILWAVVKKNMPEQEDEEMETALPEAEIDTGDMDELHQLLYQQYLNGFPELFLVYQSMLPCKEKQEKHSEAFIRWHNPQLGQVPPGKIVECVADFGIFRQFNDWIIRNVCEDLALRRDRGERMPIVHVNCPHAQITDFALNDIILKHTSKNRVPLKNVCLELDGKDISSSLEDIMLLSEMGVSICIDRFENTNEEQEIISVIKPDYVKVSLDILNSDMYATTDEDIYETTANMISYFNDILERCHKNGIKICICGIEKKSQDELVSQIGFDYKQGYYYEKPMRLEK